jgi:hypothetical protein
VCLGLRSTVWASLSIDLCLYRYIGCIPGCGNMNTCCMLPAVQSTNTVIRETCEALVGPDATAAEWEQLPKTFQTLVLGVRP